MGHRVAEDLNRNVLSCPQFWDPMTAMREQLLLLADMVEALHIELVCTKAELEQANAELKRNLLDGTLKVASAAKADSATAAKLASNAKVAAKAHAAGMLEADAGHYLRFHKLGAENQRTFELFRWDGEWFPLVEVASAGPRF